MRPKVIPSDILTAAWVLHAPASTAACNRPPHRAALPDPGLQSVVIPYCHPFVDLGAAVA